MLEQGTSQDVPWTNFRGGAGLALRRHSMPPPPSQGSGPAIRLLIVIGIVVIAGILAVDHVASMDQRFFVRSVPATRALAHYLFGDYRSAAKLYRVDLAQRMGAVPADEAWSWTTMMRGDLDRAALEARAEAGREPDNPAPLLTLAEVALARGDASTTIELAERVLHSQRDDYDALLLTAVARARQGSTDGALDALKRALRYDRAERRLSVFLSALELTGELESRPEPARPACLLAHLRRYLRIYDPAQAAGAVKYAKRAIAAGDRPDDAYVTLAVVETKRGYRRAALQAFQRAIALNPRNTAALLGAARHHADRGELADHYRLTKAAFDVAPDDPFVTAMFHGLLMQKIGDYRQARAMAERAVSVNPMDAEAWWRLAHVMSHLGDHGGALEAYQRAAALRPRVADLQTNIGHVLVALDRSADAVAAYQHAIALDPTAPDAHYGLGRIHGKQQRWTDALQEFEIGYALGGRDIEHVVGLCELYWETGQGARADACLTEVLTRDPDNQRGHALLEHVGAARPHVSASR
jgi:tetratricopeptide (TPR) repeat protein